MAMPRVAGWKMPVYRKPCHFSKKTLRNPFAGARNAGPTRRVQAASRLLEIVSNRGERAARASYGRIASCGSILIFIIYIPWDGKVVDDFSRDDDDFVYVCYGEFDDLPE